VPGLSEKHHENALRIAGILVEIGTEYLANRNLQCSLKTRLFGERLLYASCYLKFGALEY
jgi:hypothetical protein